MNTVMAPFEPLEDEVGHEPPAQRVLRPVDGAQQGPGAEETPAKHSGGGVTSPTNSWKLIH